MSSGVVSYLPEKDNGSAVRPEKRSLHHFANVTGELARCDVMPSNLVIIGPLQAGVRCEIGRAVAHDILRDLPQPRLSFGDEWSPRLIRDLNLVGSALAGFGGAR